MPAAPDPSERDARRPSRLGELARFSRHFDRSDAFLEPDGTSLDPLDKEVVLDHVVVSNHVDVDVDLRRMVKQDRREPLGTGKVPDGLRPRPAASEAAATSRWALSASHRVRRVVTVPAARGSCSPAMTFRTMK